MSIEDGAKSDRKAKRKICLCILDLVLPNVSTEAIVKELWNKLWNFYYSNSLVKILFQSKNLYNLRMKDRDSVTKHLNIFNTMISRLLYVHIKISNEDNSINFLCYLLDLWDSLVFSIGSNETTLSFDNIVSSLLLEEMR